MKPRIFSSILLFISGYSPLFVILAVRDFDFKITHKLNHPLPIYIMLGIVALSVVLLYVTVALIKPNTTSVEIVSVKNRSTDLINYTIPYMISFFGIDLSKPEDVISISIFLFILLYLTITSKSVFMNPLLAFVGYGLYDLEFKRDGKIFSTVVLSKHELYIGERYLLRSLTRFLYLIKQKVKQDNAT